MIQEITDNTIAYIKSLDLNISDEMIISFENRHNNHVDLVCNYANKIIDHYPEFNCLYELAMIHDSTKLEPGNIEYYIHFNWYIKNKDTYIIPKAIDDKLKIVRKKHTIIEPHHSAHYKNIHNMPDIRLAEMVCDWSAVNFELGTSPIDFANNTIGNTLLLNNNQINLVNDLLDITWSSIK